MKIDELVYKSLEGIITEHECRELETILASDPDAAEYYVSGIEFNNRILKVKDSIHKPLRMMMAFEEMAEYEKTAPAIEEYQETLPRELIQKVIYPPHNKKRLSKFNIVFVTMSAAATLFFFLFLELAPPKGSKVATLTDSLHAKWMDGEREMVKGTSLMTSEKSLFLHEGYVELLFDNQAKVTIEGPAEFKILADDHIKLAYGRLYAMVPREAIGFTVKTPSAQIVDLGTEFGVDCSLHSDTSLHVIKGKTVLIAGDKSNKISIEVRDGVAKKVFAATQTISDIPCNDRLFVREINSADKLIWRGEARISLADIVSGGNGFGKIHSLIGLDPDTGQHTSSIGELRLSKKGDAYNLVADSEFIDGVFVPDGGSDGTIIISSLNDTFQCPDTTGEYTHGIVVYTGEIEKQHDSIPQAVFGGQPYVNNEIVMIHSNAGITFDLQAIRQLLPGLDVTHFKAMGGLSEAIISRVKAPDVDFWVLVDGQIRYEKTGLNHLEGEVSCDIELAPKDRFLTLIVTDGVRPKGNSEWSNDFFYLIDPQLQIAER